MTLKHTDRRQPQMHKWFPLVALLLSVLASPVWADYTVDFVRISCIPDAQFLDVEYRGIHNPAISALTEHGTVRPDVLARHGFFSPSKLSYECSLPDSKYTIIATQTGWSERGMCGAAPEIFLSLQRNGEPLLERVVFGSSCFGNPSVTRITIEDGKQGWYSREAEVCLARGTDETAGKCVWFFEDYGDFKKFPIRQGDIQRLLQ
ncbi:hypothetical protein ACTHR6_25920 [Ralstonia holmesii]|uniref:hypothetical protein n=1 Tax=Ralstonia TaxID=48736 RepID=UPI001F38BE14|nr:MULTISPECIES: hypothetical protein [Ralstonia]